MNIRNFLNNKQVKNAGWLIGGKILQMIISLFVGVLTTRYLGPSNYGLIGYAGAYTAFFMAFCTLGINSILVKEFIDDPEQEGTILGSSLVLRAISSLASAFVIICIVFFVDAGETDTILVVALCSLGVVFHIFEVFNYWFQAHLRSKITAIATFIAYCITAAYRIFLMATGKSTFFFALASSVDYICIAAIILFCYFKSGGKKLKFSWNRGKKLLSKSHHFILSGLMVSIYGHTDKLMLKRMIDETEVGYYTTAVAVCGMWCFILSAIIGSVNPAIMQANHVDDELFKKKNRQLYAIVFYVSMAVAALFQIFAPLVIRILYGEPYLPSVAPLRIVTWYTAFSYLGVARNAWIVCNHKQKYLKYMYVPAVIINISLNIIFIPLWGAAGAAFASLVTELSTSVLLPLCIKDLRPNAKLILEAIILKDVLPTKQSLDKDMEA